MTDEEHYPSPTGEETLEGVYKWKRERRLLKEAKKEITGLKSLIVIGPSSDPVFRVT